MRHRRTKSESNGKEEKTKERKGKRGEDAPGLYFLKYSDSKSIRTDD